MNYMEKAPAEGTVSLLEHIMALRETDALALDKAFASTKEALKIAVDGVKETNERAMEGSKDRQNVLNNLVADVRIMQSKFSLMEGKGQGFSAVWAAALGLIMLAGLVVEVLAVFMHS